MSRCFETLESRRLLSVSSTTLVSDLATIIADGNALKADLKSLETTVRGDTNTIQNDLKGLPKTNAPLLKKLKGDEVKVTALITRDVNALDGPAGALARRSTAAGVALIAKSNAAIQAKVTADTAALNTVTAAPLARLQADEQGSGTGADLTAITSANPSDTTLATDAAKQNTDTQTGASTLNTAAAQLQTDTQALASDLAAITPGTGGGGGHVIPNLVGTFNGSGTQTAGKHVGSVTTVKLVVATESQSGVLAGNITLTQSGQAETDSFSGTVAADGAFTCTFTDSSNSTSTLTGTATANSIKGTYAGQGGDSGKFSVSR